MNDEPRTPDIERRMSANPVRILIPAKGNSVRAPGKNRLLLPHTLEYVRKVGRAAEAWVMTECPVLAEMAAGAGIRHLPEMPVSNDFAPNFTASYRAAGWNDDEVVVLLEPTKPFRQEGLLESCLKCHAEAAGKVVTTGVGQPVTYIEWDGQRAKRQVGKKILDACVVVARCGDFSKVGTMSEFWEGREAAVVWHEAPTGIDFDWPLDLETHLPTVGRMLHEGIFPYTEILW